MSSGFKRSAVVVSVLALFAAGCGDGGAGGDGAAQGGGGEGSTIRFAFSPDPVWDWLEDQGILREMEQKSGFTIQRFESEDEFAIFAGGHADVVSTASYETPILEKETGAKTVTIGKYNKAKDIIVVDDSKPWSTIADIPKGCKVGVESFSGSTNVWAALAEDMHQRELKQGSDDLEEVVTDFEVSPELVNKGDLCAGITAMTTSIPFLMNGEVKPLYDGKGASQLYAENYEPGHEGMNSNNFVVLQKYYDSHPKEVAFFLSVWERGLKEWQANRDKIIDAYPQHFGYTDDKQKQFVKDWYDNTFDEFVDSVYLTPEWLKGEQGVHEILKRAQLIPSGQAPSVAVCIDPTSGQETCRVP
jgi:ABC-type nitrate/sulfonate/bicarbonate transport system substrate-binding protein